jgi:hypothetical protein
MSITDELRKSAHEMIARWGGVGQLVRNGTPRDVTMARIEYKPAERGLFGDKASRIRVSAYDLTAPEPDHERDQIAYQGEMFNIILPVTGPRPAGEFVYYDCECMLVDGGNS